eukprot:TRINITY_DN11906_c0_g1_i1.p1 TRINITY_DN11906_c0_g1~~TRINITY_DN11906_c0_g1_i1.p1  ORF type:complete len:327 (-),score=62.12 TRINITY_DN11906_c0_g1_i1:100-1005(-)
MADDELIIPIEKALWPKGVVRGLAPVLRELGEKHGDLVLVAQPTKGHIMAKGASDQIEASKPQLRKIIEEYFPDADMPEELGSSQQGAAAPAPREEPKKEPEPPAAPSKAPTPKPNAPAAQAVAAPAPVRTKPARVMPAPHKVVIEGKPPPLRKVPQCAANAGADLLWQCMRKNSCFARKGPHGKVFSAEPANLMSFHSFQYSGLANPDALDVRPVTKGAKESIELVQSHPKDSKRQSPASMLISTGLHKCVKRGLKRLDREVLGASYRPGLYGLARQKYLRVQRSFKKKKPQVKSRRAKK